MPTTQTFYPLLLWFFLIMPGRGFGQSVLDDYIQQGLENNRLVRERNLSLAQAEKALQIARNYFMPSVTASADYTTGEGGRSIALPLGDLLGPVYRTLNELTGSDVFPEISNVKENFFPRNFYDLKLRTTVPLVNTDLYMYRQIRKDEVTLKQHELDGFKRQLVFEIKSAYFLYSSAVASVKIHETALDVVNENLFKHESLLRNGRGLRSTVLRMETEIAKVKAELTTAKNQVVNSRNYFNFLVNRDLDSEIVEATPSLEDYVWPAGDGSESTREELLAVQTARRINQTSLQLQQLNRMPKVHAFLDVGSQASDWRYNGDSRYYLLGVQVTIPVFNGFRNNLSIQQRHLEIQKTQMALEYTADQLKLSSRAATNDLIAKRTNYAAAGEQLKAAKAYYHLIETGFLEGVNSLVEFLDARSQLTAAELQLNISTFDILIALARIEHENASYPIYNHNTKYHEK